MKRCWVPCLLLLGGCTTHPVSHVRDYLRPGTFGTNKVTPYGGVCIPQGPVTGPGMPLIGVPGPGVIPPPPPPPGGGVVPPPAPLPPQG